MTSRKWEEADTAEKLEILREDIKRITNGHNSLSLKVVRDIEKVAADLKALEEKCQKT